jgi:hypothetical protein
LHYWQYYKKPRPTERAIATEDLAAQLARDFGCQRQAVAAAAWTQAETVYEDAPAMLRGDPWTVVVYRNMNLAAAEAGLHPDMRRSAGDGLDGIAEQVGQAP